jgi:hypothetical protein
MLIWTIKSRQLNQAASGNGALTPLFQLEDLGRAVPEQIHSA